MIKIASADAVKQAKHRLRGRLSPEGEDFVRLCLTRDVSSRPSAMQLLQHDFVKGATLPDSCVAQLARLAQARICSPVPLDVTTGKAARLVMRAFASHPRAIAHVSNEESSAATVRAAAALVQYRRMVEVGRRRLARFIGLPTRARARAVAAAIRDHMRDCGSTIVGGPRSGASRNGHLSGRDAAEDGLLESSGETEGMSVSTMLSAATAKGDDAALQSRAPSLAECARACSRAEQHLSAVAEFCSSSLWALRDWWTDWDIAAQEANHEAEPPSAVIAGRGNGSINGMKPDRKDSANFESILRRHEIETGSGGELEPIPWSQGMPKPVVMAVPQTGSHKMP